MHIDKLLPCFFWVVFSLILSLPLYASEISSERITFDKGANGKTIKRQIKGNEAVDYLVNAKAKQRLMVVLETNNASNYFNILAPGKQDEALFVGSSAGNRYEGAVPEEGDYTIRVYLMRSAARRNESANYSLAVNVFGTGAQVAAPANDFADGYGGGPDYWQVFNVKSDDTLKMRSKPSAKSKVLAQFHNGDILQNLGCQKVGKQRWCKVVEISGKAGSGWVAGTYLRESADPGQAQQNNQDVTLKSESVKGDGQAFHATGDLPCSVAAGQPTHNCAFGVVRKGGGNATVWINTGGKEERRIVFESGKPVTSNSAGRLSFQTSKDLFLIQLGTEERYEIPDVVVQGD